LLRDSSAAESIYGFAQEQADVQPEESIFVLTSSQLQELITKATKSLNSRVDALEDRIIQLEGDKTKIEAMQKDMDHLADNQLIQLRLIADLRKDHEPQPLQKDRGEILRALLVANGGKMLAKEARKVMHLRKDRFSKLLAVCNFIETKPYHLDRRQDVIIMKS
jgi:hypothetical protein